MTELITMWESSKDQLFDEVCNALGTKLTENAMGIPGLTDKDELAKIACLYAAGTMTYLTLVNSSKNTLGAFFILRYKDESINDFILRPATVSQIGLLTPDSINKFVAHILEMDKKSHPERFKSAKVFNFPTMGNNSI